MRYGVTFYGPMVAFKLRIKLLVADAEDIAQVFKRTLSIAYGKNDTVIITGALDANLYAHLKDMLAEAKDDYIIMMANERKANRRASRNVDML